ncbi:MAG: hypothetical protein Q8K82_06370 [Gemmatimonadaceae bacterium]|nr:hypothetical protein [Gemmatimonadaceae bacterium]
MADLEDVVAAVQVRSNAGVYRDDDGDWHGKVSVGERLKWEFAVQLFTQERVRLHFKMDYKQVAEDFFQKMAFSTNSLGSRNRRADRLSV